MVSYFYPESLEEALTLRREREVKPLAGGTDLMVRYENWSGLPAAFPWDVMGVSQLEELRFIRREEEVLAIGAGTTLDAIIRHPDCPDLLKRALGEIAAPALRNLATLAGNIANASPAADSLPPLAVMDATVRLISREGRRSVPIGEFITGPGKTVLRREELIEAVCLPLDFLNREAEGRSFYRKVGTRKANALSKLSYCAWARRAEGRLEELRLCVGGAAPTVVRLPEAEALLKGAPLAELPGKWRSVRKRYEERITPIDDQRSTAAYRKRTALRLLDHVAEELSSS